MADRSQRIHNAAGQAIGYVRVFGGELTVEERQQIAAIFATARSRFHDCLMPGCHRRPPMNKAFCRGCWKQIPEHLQQRIHAAYQTGQTAATASEEYLQALQDAITTVQRRRGDTGHGQPAR